MTDNTPEGTPTDTSAPAPQDGLTIEFADADTQGAEPVGHDQGDAVAPEPQSITFAGKEYPSLAEAERAYQEAQRVMHERSEEAATYRKAIESIQAPIPAPQMGQPGSNEALNDQFRSQLENDPWNTLQAFVRHNIQQEQAQAAQHQSAMMGEVQQYAQDPLYQDVAQDVMRQLPFTPEPNVENMFLRAKLQKMQDAMTNGGAAAAAQAQRMHVESGTSRQPDNTLRIQIDPDAHRVKGAFRDTDEGFVASNKVAAVIKQQGMGGKNPVSLDQYRAARRKAGVE